jgi:predicted DNA-binding ArsR family transcriptional regulator
MEGKHLITPRELITIHRCLSSRVCRRIFRTLLTYRRLNISAISRKARCTRKDGIRHLRSLAELGIVEEKFRNGLHTFTLKGGELTELMEKTVKMIEAEK